MLIIFGWLLQIFYAKAFYITFLTAVVRSCKPNPGYSFTVAIVAANRRHWQRLASLNYCNALLILLFVPAAPQFHKEAGMDAKVEEGPGQQVLWRSLGFHIGDQRIVLT